MMLVATVKNITDNPRKYVVAKVDSKWLVNVL